MAHGRKRSIVLSYRIVYQVHDNVTNVGLELATHCGGTVSVVSGFKSEDARRKIPYDHERKRLLYKRKYLSSREGKSNNCSGESINSPRTLTLGRSRTYVSGVLAGSSADR